MTLLSTERQLCEMSFCHRWNTAPRQPSLGNGEVNIEHTNRCLCFFIYSIKTDPKSAGGRHKEREKIGMLSNVGRGSPSAARHVTSPERDEGRKMASKCVVCDSNLAQLLYLQPTHRATRCGKITGLAPVAVETTYFRREVTPPWVSHFAGATC